MKILFVSADNSCRSLIAEALCRWMAEDVECWSCGGRPAKEINPFAKQVLEELEIPTDDLRPKGILDVPSEDADLIITLCDEDLVPPLPPDTAWEAWPTDHPAAHKDETPEKRLKRFRRTREEIRGQLEALLEM